MKRVTFDDIGKWECEMGESFLDYNESLVSYAFYLGFTLGRYPQHYQKIYECFEEGVQSLVDLENLYYDDEGKEVEYQNNIGMVILLDILNSSEVHNERFWNIIENKNTDDNSLEENGENDLFLTFTDEDDV